MFEIENCIEKMNQMNESRSMPFSLLLVICLADP